MRTDFNTLKIIESDGIAQIVLSRPEQRNAVSHEMQTEIDLALDAAEIDPEVLAVVLRGEGSVFTAGHDLKEEYSGKSFPAILYPNASPSIDPRLPRAWYFRKPLIGAAHRYVGPYGMALLGCCDFNIAGEGTRFSCEVYNGGSPGVAFLPFYLQFPMRVVEKLFLMGGWMDEQRALEFQFVQRVVPEDEVKDEAMRWAIQASHVPSAAFTYGKERIRRSIELLGLNALPSVLMPYGPPRGPNDEATIALEQGIAAAVKAREKAFNPEISQI